jgi:hypothetical protein
LEHLGTAALAGPVAAGLAVAARSSAVALLVVVAVVQAALAVSWVFGARVPGRIGGVICIGLAAAGADVTVSVWPHSRLGTLLAVFGLTVLALFVHQVFRGAARVRLVDSIGSIALGVLSAVGLAALVQLRHEWVSPALGGRVVAGVAAAAGAALLVGALIDLITPVPHFDPRVPRGLLAVIGSTGAGSTVGHVLLRSDVEFVDGRGAFVGGAVGALVGFLAVAVSFVVATTDDLVVAPTEADAGRSGGTAQRHLRPVLATLVPLGLAAPVGYLLCLAVRA